MIFLLQIAPKDFAATPSQKAKGIDVWEITGLSPRADYIDASSRNTIPALNRNFLWPEVEVELGHIKGYFPTKDEIKS